MIKIRNLTKKYKDITAVDDLSLNIEKGELVALLGVNGAGKSTTIKMLSCLTAPSSGDAFIEGKSIVNEVEKIKKLISVSPQDSAIASGLTVKENLEFMCGIFNINTSAASEMMDLFGLNEFKNKRTKNLSGGYKRRLSIAMALISNPEVLFLDEPTLGLDVISRSELWDIIRLLKGKKTIILTTHYMEEAEKLSDRVAIMKSGKLLVFDTQDNIKRMVETENFEEAFIRIVKGDF